MGDEDLDHDELGGDCENAIVDIDGWKDCNYKLATILKMKKMKYDIDSRYTWVNRLSVEPSDLTNNTMSIIFDFRG